MPNLSLGTIEVLGLPAAVEAADVALKAADVKLIGYETTDGMGMVAVKIEGQVSAVQSAVAAARAASSRVSKVFATSVIPRPSAQLEPVVLTDGTVVRERPAPEPPAPPSVEPPAQPLVQPPAQPLVEPVETSVSTSSTSGGEEPIEPPVADTAISGGEDLPPAPAPRARTRKPPARPKK